MVKVRASNDERKGGVEAKGGRRKIEQKKERKEGSPSKGVKANALN